MHPVEWHGSFCELAQKETDLLIQGDGKLVTLITLGPEGTFSHDLALKMDTEIILVPTISTIFSKVLSDRDTRVVP